MNEIQYPDIRETERDSSLLLQDCLLFYKWKGFCRQCATSGYVPAIWIKVINYRIIQIWNTPSSAEVPFLPSKLRCHAFKIRKSFSVWYFSIEICPASWYLWGKFDKFQKCMWITVSSYQQKKQFALFVILQKPDFFFHLWKFLIRMGCYRMQKNIKKFYQKVQTAEWRLLNNLLSEEWRIIHQRSEIFLSPNVLVAMIFIWKSSVNIPKLALCQLQNDENILRLVTASLSDARVWFMQGDSGNIPLWWTVFTP